MSFPTICVLSTHLIHPLFQACLCLQGCCVLSLTEALGAPRSPQVLTMSHGDLHLLSRLIPPP